MSLLYDTRLYVLLKKESLVENLLRTFLFYISLCFQRDLGMTKKEEKRKKEKEREEKVR
jgi:hypothetical protein